MARFAISPSSHTFTITTTNGNEVGIIELNAQPIPHKHGASVPNVTQLGVAPEKFNANSANVAFYSNLILGINKLYKNYGALVSFANISYQASTVAY